MRAKVYMLAIEQHSGYGTHVSAHPTDRARHEALVAYVEEWAHELNDDDAEDLQIDLGAGNAQGAIDIYFERHPKGENYWQTEETVDLVEFVDAGPSPDDNEALL